MPRDDREGGGVMCFYKNELKVEKIKIFIRSSLS